MHTTWKVEFKISREKVDSKIRRRVFHVDVASLFLFVKDRSKVRIEKETI